jgi:hypothetical protein
VTETGSTAVDDYGQPQPPIIILGRDEAFLAFARSVEDAIEQVRRADPDQIPPPTRLDFFDVLGRRLEPIIVGGELVSLAVQDSQEEIRYRIGRLYHYLSIGVPRGEVPPDRRPFPDGLSFEEAIRQLADRQAVLQSSGCSWWAHILGRC